MKHFPDDAAMTSTELCGGCTGMARELSPDGHLPVTQLSDYGTGHRHGQGMVPGQLCYLSQR
jgi:hypothetical protein